MSDRTVRGFLAAFLAGYFAGRKSRRIIKAPPWANDVHTYCCDVSHKSWERKYWIASTIVSSIGLLAAGLAAYYAKCAFEQAQRQAQASEDQIALQYTPKIKIIRMGIKSSDNNREEVNFDYFGNYTIDVYLVNAGQAGAVVTEARVMPYWKKGPLPMNVPYFDPKNKRLFVDKLPNVIGEASSSPKPKEFLNWRFDIEVPRNHNKEMNLYIVGYVKYKDTREFYRITLFGRQYNADKHRFVPVDDPDYEEPELN